MIFGPIFYRELKITPRRSRIYVARTVYSISILILVATVWLILSGAQNVADPGDMSRFGTLVFSILAPLQLTLSLFLSAIFSAGNVAQEKDRNTLVLLLLTRMSNLELVLGKLAASLLHLCVNLVAVIPVFFMLLIFGGVDSGQIIRCFTVTFATIFLCGTLGTFLAFWREQTFQAVAMTVLILVAWLAFWEVVAAGALGETWLGISSSFWAMSMSPWRAILAVTQAFPPVFVVYGISMNAVWTFPCVAVFFSFLMIFWAVIRVRVWNPSRTERKSNIVRSSEITEKQDISVAPAENLKVLSENETQTLDRRIHGEKFKTRHVWDNPVLWRETRTYAYGKKAFLVRAAYVLIFVLACGAMYQAFSGLDVSLYSGDIRVFRLAAITFLPLSLLSLVLINTQAVTAITGERDGRTLDLLRATELTPKEIVLGKFGGILWNTREMILCPILLVGYFYFCEIITLEICGYLLGGFLVLVFFAVMLGIHTGMTYAVSRSAVGVSLGTVFFLFIGVAVCLRMMLAMGDSFQAQLQPFLAIMVGGGVAMYLALGARNPSPAIALASFGCPFATFYAITALMLNYTLGVFLVMAITYGFTSAAMMIPAISEFDVADTQHHSEE
ncbi:MAG: hypothetical protein Q4C96_11285 [Planctomycetia bacterium]|nr:hypothetical protein [Planctomycetia bacterium]